MSAIFSTFLFSFKSTFRNLKSNGIMFILPVVFMGIFGLVFSSSSSLDFSLGVYQTESSLDLAQIYQQTSDSSPDLEIQVITYDDQNELEKDLKENQIDLGLVLDRPLAEGGRILIQSPDNGFSSTLYTSAAIDILNQTVFDSNPIDTMVIDPDKLDLNGFDYLAPGLIVYGLIILIPGIAHSFSAITEKGYIFRYSFARISSLEIILGNVLFYLFVGVIQTFLLYFTAIIFGYQATGNISLAILPITLTLLFVIATGLLLGAIFKKTEAASNTGTILSVILGFLSGSFIAGIGQILEFEIGGMKFQFNDFLPTKWATTALEKILTQGLEISDIYLELGILGISGVLTLLLSIWLYSKLQLRSEIQR